MKTIYLLITLLTFISRANAETMVDHGAWIEVIHNNIMNPQSYEIINLDIQNYSCNDNEAYEFFAIFDDGSFMSSRDEEFNPTARKFNVSNKKVTHFYVSSIYDDDPPPFENTKLVASSSTASSDLINLVSKSTPFANQDVVITQNNPEEIIVIFKISENTEQGIQLDPKGNVLDIQNVNLNFTLHTSIDGFTIDNDPWSPASTFTEEDDNKFELQLETFPTDGLIYFDLKTPTSNDSEATNVTFTLKQGARIVDSHNEIIGDSHDPNNIELIDFKRNDDHDILFYRINFQNGFGAEPGGKPTKNVNVVIKKLDWWDEVKVHEVKISEDSADFRSSDFGTNIHSYLEEESEDKLKIIMQNCPLQFCSNPSFPGSTGFVTLKVKKTKRFPTMNKKCNTVFGLNLVDPNRETFVKVQFNTHGTTFHDTIIWDSREIRPHKRIAKRWYTRFGNDFLCFLGFNNR